MESETRMLLDGPTEELPTVPLGRESNTIVDSFDLSSLLNQEPGDNYPDPPSQPAAGSATGEKPDGDSSDSTGEQTTADESEGSTSSVETDTEFKESVAERLNSIESTLASLTDSVSETGVIQSEVNGLKSKLNDVAADVDDVVEEVDDVQASIADVPSTVEEVETNLAAVESEMSELSEELHTDTHSLTAQVVRQGELVLLRIDAAQLPEDEGLLDHGQDIEIAIPQSEWD
jgi:uncharacterized protein YoxC